jgi:hypothetical protein
MEILKIIYVALIEGIKSYVAVEAKELERGLYLIVNSKLFDPDDNTTLFQFIPGDTVSCKVEFKKDYNNNEEQVLVANSLVASDVPNRGLYMLKFLIADQAGVLTANQVELFSNELKMLKEELLKNKDNEENLYHPSILRWSEAFSLE